MKIKYSILIGLLVLLLFSCEKPDPNGCHNAVIFYNYLSDAARNQTPYFTNPAFDTISFASDKGDTLIFVKTKTDSTWYKEEIRGNPACDWDKEYYQVLHNKYTTLKGNGSFDVKYSYKTQDYGLFRIEIFFNNIHFIICECIIDDVKYKNYIGDFTVNNKTFTNTFYEYNNISENTKGIGYINKGLGLFYLIDPINDLKWLIIK
jgi:hypothetical protein